MTRLALFAAAGAALAAAMLAGGIPASPGHRAGEAATPGAPDPRTCDPNAGAAVLCVSQHAPQAGRIFTGGYVWIQTPATTRVTKLSCNAKLGGKVAESFRYGAVYFDGGVRLPPIWRRTWTRPDVDGTRHLARATCSWRIPRGARGKLLSLLHRPEDLGDEDAEWGLHFETGGEMRECNQTTWRVGVRGLVTPEPRFRRFC